MFALTDKERELLERLAAEGKASRLALGELQIAKSLEAEGLIFMIRNTLDAIVTPKGRHVLADQERASKPAKKPFGFLD
jgi:hypothetical protein